jgi:hypothetical protein
MIVRHVAYRCDEKPHRYLPRNIEEAQLFCAEQLQASLKLETLLVLMINQPFKAKSRCLKMLLRKAFDYEARG